MNKFKKPLSNIELNECFIRLNNGDKQARNEIFEHNLRLLNSLVNRMTIKYGLNPQIKEDIFQVGSIGLLKSIDTFDITRNIAFSTYAAKYITNEVLMYFRKNKIKVNNVSLDQPIDDEQDLVIGDFIEDEKANFLDDLLFDINSLEISEELKKAMNILNKKDLNLIYLYFFSNKGYTQDDIAKIFGVTHQYVSASLKRIEKKLYFKLKQDGYNEETIKYYLKY